jgi:hypothetical protein
VLAPPELLLLWRGERYPCLHQFLPGWLLGLLLVLQVPALMTQHRQHLLRGMGWVAAWLLQLAYAWTPRHHCQQQQQQQQLRLLRVLPPSGQGCAEGT